MHVKKTTDPTIGINLTLGKHCHSLTDSLASSATRFKSEYMITGVKRQTKVMDVLATTTTTFHCPYIPRESLPYYLPTLAKPDTSQLFGDEIAKHSGVAFLNSGNRMANHFGPAALTDGHVLKPAHHFSEALISLFLPLLSLDNSDTTSISGHELTSFALQNTSLRNDDTVSTTSAGYDTVQQSCDALHKVLNSGATIYGVNTGYGGSAGARTTHHEELQVALIQMLSSASYTATEGNPKNREAQEEAIDAWVFEVSDAEARNMPIKWVRAAMLVRANTLLRGHSGATKKAVNGLLELLNAGITPVVPLTGSISASGDLSPLSFVVSTLQGLPSVMAWDHSDLSNIRTIPADEALQSIGLVPLICGPKEALAIVNGTAFSDAVGGLVVNDAMVLAALSQMLTAMGVEALCGHVESFDPFIAEVKNDDQMIEVARTIRGFLSGSKLAVGLDVSSIDDTDEKDATIGGTVIYRTQKLAQDRYALRTSSQWLSPPVREILSAFLTVQTCLNSTTDNPIVDPRDPSNPRILNGGNFQGSTTAGAMDKTRSALQLIGKLMFAQSTEIINPATNNGLPANLAATDPSMDFACKGLDINIAAYCSELGWLANPVGPHVQSAEMHNQAVNSLALISARKTSEAISILQKMMASCLYIVCQGLDIRVMQLEFFKEAKSSLSALARTLCFDAKLEEALWTAVKTSFEQSGTYDLVDRVDKAAASASPVLLACLVAKAKLRRDSISSTRAFPSRRASSTGQQDAGYPLCDSDASHISANCVERWQASAKTLLTDRYNETRATHFSNYVSATPKALGVHTGAMYSFVRKELGVPMFQGLADNPTRENGKKHIGGYVGIVEKALRRRKVMMVLGKAVRDVAGINALFPGEQTVMQNEGAK